MSIYLDHNASTPLDERVLEAMLPYLREGGGNPSSLHQFGRMARAAVDRAREQVAALVNAHPSQVIFTSGGTEANNLALKGVMAMQPAGRLAVSAAEHASLLGPARALQAQGRPLDMIAVDEHCQVSVTALQAALHPDTRLVSVMSANNETGVIEDVAALAATAREAGVAMHTDAVQAAGKWPLDFAASGVQLMSLSAHKLYGPKGVGALITDKTLELEALIHGGGQEKGLRGGTENVAALVGFGAAAELAQQELTTRMAQMRALRDELEGQLAGIKDVVIFAREAQRLPNTLQLAVAGLDGETLLMQLDRDGIAVSSGSACASGSTEPSHVLMAMGVDRELARAAVRISLGKGTQASHLQALVESLRRQVNWLNKVSAGAAAW